MSPNPLGSRLEQLAQAVAERVVNLVLEAIDLDALLERVDVDRIVARVDVNALLERVDVDRIVERVDVNAVVERVDIDHVVEQLDIDSLVAQTELGAIIAKSTTGVLTEVLDLLRSQGVGLDDFIARWTDRLLRRDPGSLPLGPPLLTTAAGPSNPDRGS